MKNKQQQTKSESELKPKSEQIELKKFPNKTIFYKKRPIKKAVDPNSFRLTRNQNKHFASSVNRSKKNGSEST